MSTSSTSRSPGPVRREPRRRRRTGWSRPENDRWQAERDHRLELEQSPAPLPAQEQDLLAAMLDQHGLERQRPAPGRVRNGADSGRSYRERQGEAEPDRRPERT